MKQPENLTGYKYARLTVLEMSGRRSNGVYIWSCQCECGKILNVKGTSLKGGITKSCGCYREDRMKTLNLGHGLRNHYIYNIWRGIKKRCYNPTHQDYKNYGGRGIIMADEWLNDVKAFYDHLGERPTPKHQIDRENNDGNYIPGNVRWVTPKVNVNNKRISIRTIGKFSRSGVLIKKYSTPSEAIETEYLCYTTLYRCLQGKIKTHRGFIWKSIQNGQ